MLGTQASYGIQSGTNIALRLLYTMRVLSLFKAGSLLAYKICVSLASALGEVVFIIPPVFDII